MPINDIFGTILFGGTAQTSWVGMVALVVPPPAGLTFGAVFAAVILVSVPGQEIDF